MTALTFSLASTAPKKSQCGAWANFGNAARKAAAFDKMMSGLKGAKDPDAMIAKFFEKNGLPFTATIQENSSLPQDRLQNSSEFAEEIVTFKKQLPIPEGNVFYEFAETTDKKPLRQWQSPDADREPGDLIGDEMIFKHTLNSICSSEFSWRTGLALKPNGKFRIVPYKNEQVREPLQITECPAMAKVFTYSKSVKCVQIKFPDGKIRFLVYDSQ